jgi:hypothetical protein
VVQYRYTYSECMNGEYIHLDTHPSLPQNIWLSLQCPVELPRSPPVQG